MTILPDLRKVFKALVLLTALLVTNMTNAQTPFTGAGGGTVAAPYEITTEAQLKEIANGLSAHYKLMNDITLTGAWTPIGVVAPYFTGTLDGDGHKITGLYTELVKGGALIGTSNNGTIKNLGVEITGEGIKALLMGGGIVAQNAGLISNCYVTGTSIYVEGDDGADADGCAGGIAGRNLNLSTGGKILNCYSSVEIITVNRASGSKDKYVGGIAGQNSDQISGCLAINGELIFQEGGKSAYYGMNGAITNNSSSNCTNCFASYKTKLGITTSTSVYSGIPWDGTAPNEEDWAISGDDLVLYKAGTTTPMKTISISSYKYLDGAGTEQSPYLINNEADLRKLSDYTNNGKGSCEGTFYKLAADIQMSAAAFIPISNKVYEIGNFSFRKPFSGTFDGDGKIISNLHINSSERYNGLFGTVEGCTIKNLGLKDCDINITSTGNMIPSVGAFVGADRTISQAITKASTIENCFATGSVKMAGEVNNDGGGGTGCIMGGIVGISSLIKVVNCYTDLSLLNQDTANATYNSIGGIVGRVDVNAKDEDDIVKNCYVLGNITSTKELVHIGGIVGFRSENKKISNNLVLCKKIEKVGDGYIHRIAAASTKEENLTNNYALKQMVLIANGSKVTPDPESALDGTDWDGTTAPSEDWSIEGGYLNLNAISTTFGNKTQIKLNRYVAQSIQIEETTAEFATITSEPATEAYPGDSVYVKIEYLPNLSYRLKPGSLKYNGNVISEREGVLGFVMPEGEVQITGEFQGDTLHLDNIQSGDSLYVYKENDSWMYGLKETQTKALGNFSALPFNGILSGVLADNKSIVFEPSCKDELIFDQVVASEIVIKEGASVVLSKSSELTYTNINNEGGGLVAREGATITNATSGQVKMNKFTITSPQNGTLAVLSGNVAIASGDMLAEGTEFTVTATPASGYEKESQSVKSSAGNLVASNGVYQMPDAEVTVTATFKSTYVPPVPPAPTVYYTITLPSVKGATTTPGAGDYSVEDGLYFSFFLKLESGYEHSVPVVIANGVTITPRESDGKYVIRNIWSDMQIQITGIHSDIPTGNAEIENGTKIWRLQGALLVRVDRPCNVVVLTASGQIVRNLQLSAGENRIDGLAQDLYMVKVEGETTVKVMLY